MSSLCFCGFFLKIAIFSEGLKKKFSVILERIWYILSIWIPYYVDGFQETTRAPFSTRRRYIQMGNSELRIVQVVFLRRGRRRLPCTQMTIHIHGQ
jgi:hypothetical protein